MHAGLAAARGSLGQRFKIPTIPVHLVWYWCFRATNVLTGFRSAIIFNQMVKYVDATLDSTFAALADPTRRSILERLAHGESSVTELAQPFDVSLPAISKHLGVLENAGLLLREKDGRVRRCRLAAAPMKDAVLWMEQYRSFWEDKLSSLATYLSELQNQEESHDPTDA